VPSNVVASGEDRLGPVNLHRLTDPRPFALLVYGSQVVDQNSLPEALHAVNLRQQIVLTEKVDVEVAANPPQSSAARVIDFQPERFTVEANTPVTAFLSVANPYYPGWEATIDGQPTTILRAYGALSAVVVPAGEHIIRFVYDPLTYRIGALISLFTWSALAVFVLVVAARRWRQV
jgi:hypothetical protein